MKLKPTKNTPREILNWLALPLRLLLTLVFVLAMLISTPFAWISGAFKTLFRSRKK